MEFLFLVSREIGNRTAPEKRGKGKDLMMRKMLLAVLVLALVLGANLVSAYQKDVSTSESGRFTSWTEVEKVYDENGDWLDNTYNVHLFDNLESVEYVVTNSGLRPYNGYSSVNDRGDVYWLEVNYGDSDPEDIHTVRWWNVFSGSWDDLFRLTGGFDWVKGIQSTNDWVTIEVVRDFDCDQYDPCGERTIIEVFSAVSREHVVSFEFWDIKDFTIQGDKLAVRRDVSDPDDEESFYVIEMYDILSDEEPEPEEDPAPEHHENHHEDNHSSDGPCFIGALL